MADSRIIRRDVRITNQTGRELHSTKFRESISGRQVSLDGRKDVVIVRSGEMTVELYDSGSFVFFSNDRAVYSLDSLLEAQASLRRKHESFS